MQNSISRVSVFDMLDIVENITLEMETSELFLNFDQLVDSRLEMENR